MYKRLFSDAQKLLTHINFSDPKIAELVKESLK